MCYFTIFYDFIKHFFQNFYINCTNTLLLPKSIPFENEYYAESMIGEQRMELKKIKKEHFFLLMFLFVITFLFLFNSPLHIWKCGETGTDSSVFKTVALMMSKGYMPYRDSFDHKGPLLYFYNLWGMGLAPYRGVWVIEFVSLFITFSALYKIARLKCGKTLSCICLILASIQLFDCFEGGNLVEEYALPFLSISLYIFLDYFINQKISMPRLLICGACFGCVCLLRPNMISVWLVFCTAVLIFCIKNKNISELKSYIIGFFIGFLFIILPVMVWLLIHHSFFDFLYNYIFFNVIYSSAEGGRALLSAKWSSFFTFLNKPIILVSFMLDLYFCAMQKTEKYIYQIHLIYMFCTLLLICLSGMVYGHYGMILIPCIIFPLASAFQLCLNSKKEFIIVILLFGVELGAFSNWATLAGNTLNIYENKNNCAISNNVKTICELIHSQTTPSDEISVYGNWDIIYVLSNRKHATRYSYQFPIGTVVPDIMDNYFEELEASSPAIIVIQQGLYNSTMKDFLDNHSYTLLWNENEDLQRGALVFKRIQTES